MYFLSIYFYNVWVALSQLLCIVFIYIYNYYYYLAAECVGVCSQFLKPVLPVSRTANVRGGGETHLPEGLSSTEYINDISCMHIYLHAHTSIKMLTHPCSFLYEHACIHPLSVPFWEPSCPVSPTAGRIRSKVSISDQGIATCLDSV